MGLQQPWQVWVDTGGTFTDCLARDPSGNLHRAKVLSISALRGTVVDADGPERLRVRERWNAPAGFVNGFRFRLLGEGGGKRPVTVTGYDPAASIVELNSPVAVLPGASFEVLSPEEAPVLAARLVTRTPAGQPLPPLQMRLATTRGTNALLERRGARAALLITEGFGDLLIIGDQQRPDLFALDIRKPEPLYAAVVEVPERLAADGAVLKPLDAGPIRGQIESLLDAGIETAAVALLHSYRNPAHEQALEEHLRAMGFRHVSASARLAPSIKLLDRAQTAVVDAYLAPIIGDYLDAVRRGLGSRAPDDGGTGAGYQVDGESASSLHVMTSAGGLVRDREFRAMDSLLSGPAGGVVGAAFAAEQAGLTHSIAFDMGGTSTDVSRYEGAFDYVFEHQVAGALLAAPALAIETVAAGGGSICRFDGHSLRVGPESAGANPGPACYGAGGPLTLTDVHLLLGRLDPSRLEIPILYEDAETAFGAVQENILNSRDTGRDRLLQGFLDIADERMADAIRSISVRQGRDPSGYALVAFGGAGGLHACRVADLLEIRTVLAPADAGLLSALGLGRASIERFSVRQVLQPLDVVSAALPGWLREMESEAVSAVTAEGIPSEAVQIRRRIANLRLLGQDSVLSVDFSPGTPGSNPRTLLHDLFGDRYCATFGHPPPDRPVELESLRVVAGSRVAEVERAPSPPGPAGAQSPSHSSPLSTTTGRRRACFEGTWQEVPTLDRDQLPAGELVSGPALVFDRHSALVIEPGWTATAQPGGALLLWR